MSLETEIKNLREAIEAATKVFAELNQPIITCQEKLPKEVKEKISIGYKPAENIHPVEEQSKNIEKVEAPKVEEVESIEETVKKPIKIKVSGIKQKEELKKETDEVAKVSFEDVQQIAKEKMKKANVDRNVIKKIITDIKVDAQISDLNDDELVTAFNKINEL
jgi:hypothetical protein